MPMVGTPRREFLKTIRTALGRKEEAIKAPAHPSGQVSLANLEKQVENIHLRLSKNRNLLIEALAKSAEGQGWQVHIAKDVERARQYIMGICREKSVRLAVRTSHPVLERLKLDESFTEAGIEVTTMARANGTSENEARNYAAEADIGVTGADYAIVETGSCVLQPRQGISRKTSLLPPVHIAVVESHEILETLDDLFTLWSLQVTKSGDFGSYLNIISGPSRTADIEQTIIVGVHGPKEVHLVLLADYLESH